MTTDKFYRDQSLTPVAMATKFEIKSSINRLVYEISQRSLRPTWGFQGRSIEWCHTNSTTTALVAMATIFETKCGKYHRDACATIVQLNNVSQILPQKNSLSHQLTA